jgi:hypothetical protein
VRPFIAASIASKFLVSSDFRKRGEIGVRASGRTWIEIGGEGAAVGAEELLAFVTLGQLGDRLLQDIVYGRSGGGDDIAD